MSNSGDGTSARRLTSRGAATKARIVEAANQLMFERGVALTTLADVRTASATSKSQLYQHFADKNALVREVIEFRAEALLTQQRRRLEKVDSLRGLELWRDEMVERNALRDGAYGCPLGSIANEIADHDEDTRRIIASHFDEWLQMIIDAIDRLKTNRVLREDADARSLAGGLLAALQGGYLLAKTARDVNLMRVAVDMAIAQVRAFSTELDTQG
ncbi:MULTISPECIES: TetR/AcrR family transcriptional regulator [Microbacterium]|uniref:TetR/AcrR family transcriptional regulator n=1 Tax=Microbacterium TaxID=33882 RepID=UPI001C636496|nr:TetR/AcrR family transcriptional regulator [Microbacterium sp. PAMC22086]QYG11414.1 TetR/AcrR family transcriptional regulator [Microbacterium sp. PAMC22086]